MLCQIFIPNAELTFSTIYWTPYPVKIYHENELFFNIKYRVYYLTIAWYANILAWALLPLIWSVYLHIFLRDNNLAGVGKVDEEGEGEGVHVVYHHLGPTLLSQIVWQISTIRTELTLLLGGGGPVQLSLILPPLELGINERLDELPK